jgi:hypothetical protein
VKIDPRLRQSLNIGAGALAVYVLVPPILAALYSAKHGTPFNWRVAGDFLSWPQVILWTMFFMTMPWVIRDWGKK